MVVCVELSVCINSVLVLASLVFFFFKQKTAYDIEYGLVGSEMCIRDRERTHLARDMGIIVQFACDPHVVPFSFFEVGQDSACLLYTSDAADERSSVDLGGRRIIKKKTQLERRESAVIIYNKKRHTQR